MQKTLLLMLLLVCLDKVTTAQTPTYSKLPLQATNTNGNTFPFGNSATLTTNGIKWQTLYPIAYLTPKEFEYTNSNFSANCGFGYNHY
jgi:hypothetical protein